MSTERENETNGKENEIAKETKYGCEHYRRKCQFMTPCCNKTYVCRFCHDEKEDHILNRKNVEQIQCLKCNAVQEIGGRECCQCGILFGNYFCSICKLFDDELRGQFHCHGCGICRIGGRDKFFHCDVCDMCLPIGLMNNHECVEKVSRSNCPICLEDLHTSRTGSHIPPCGHLIHRNCFKELLRSGNYACPSCSVSMVNMTAAWSLMDAEILTTPMPDEYRDYNVWILCRDCHKECRVIFHVLGLKCKHCGSYNTCRTKEPLAKVTADVAESKDPLADAAE